MRPVETTSIPTPFALGDRQLTGSRSGATS